MFLIPPISPAFDRIPEKIVQDAIHSLCDPMLVRREVQYDRYLADFLTPKYIVEVKKSSANGQSTAVHHTLGQVLYYSVAHRLTYFDYRLPVILIYGSYTAKYTADQFTQVREFLGVRLWVLISLRDGVIFDVDSGIYREIKDLFSELPDPDYS
jgi:hypothetical protein